MTQPFATELCHGLVEAGRRHTRTVLRDPTGRDELRLAEMGPRATPAEHASSVIAALTLGVGDIASPTGERLLALTAGDRERLLLAVCSRLHGPRIDLVATCPSCAELSEIPVRFDEVIAVRPASPPVDERRVGLEADDGRWTALCRPPTGADLEKAARGGPGAARALLVDCLLELADPAGRPVPTGALPEACASPLAQALADFDPAAECNVEIECPACGGRIAALLDGLTILQSTLGTTARLYDDVYRMARSYHWSEAEILSLPLRRRRLYLAIADSAEARR